MDQYGEEDMMDNGENDEVEDDEDDENGRMA